jgi:hypothetical protein
MKRLAVVLASLWLLFLFCGRAAACLNDGETARAEKEFKSSYHTQPSTPPLPPEESPAASNPLVYYGLGGLGVALLLGAFVVTVWQPRRPKLLR